VKKKKEAQIKYVLNATITLRLVRRKVDRNKSWSSSMVITTKTTLFYSLFKSFSSRRRKERICHAKSLFKLRVLF